MKALGVDILTGIDTIVVGHLYIFLFLLSDTFLSNVLLVASSSVCHHLIWSVYKLHFHLLFLAIKGSQLAKWWGLSCILNIGLSQILKKLVYGLAFQWLKLVNLCCIWATWGVDCVWVLNESIASGLLKELNTVVIISAYRSTMYIFLYWNAESNMLNLKTCIFSYIRCHV